MRRPMIQWMGLTGVLALLSYTAAVLFSPLAYPGYDALAQAVSDLSAQNAPSGQLWRQLAALYDICSVVCMTCVSLFVSRERTGTKLLRTGLHLFTAMNWLSAVGYRMFPLDDAGKEIRGFEEVMHILVTAGVVLLSILSLVLLIVQGFRRSGLRGLGIWAMLALGMMFAGTAGQGIVPPAFFGIAERLSLFSAVGFGAVLGVYLFCGFSRERSAG
ncbi:MAG: DUF998 domain-containing protein [Oscillospiraceae bacterium]|nr:DUF998 domain-containing protein [Oscillospiraceae bacterium]